MNTGADGGREVRQDKTLERKVFACIQEYHMIEADQRIMIGVSGGADSVCLLFMLKEYSGYHNVDLAVVHINHGLRPESEEEAEYVEELCRRLEVPFYYRKLQLNDDNVTKGMSPEEAARELRYGAFRECAGEWKADKLAVAHNADDNAETMLFHLFRGTGVRGLAGIPPVRDEIIRPMITTGRAEIEAYLHDRRISYCTDASNGADVYTRNRIRHHILPYAREHIAEGCVERMGQTAEILRETEDFLEKSVSVARSMCVESLEEAGAEFSEAGKGLYRLDAGEYAQLHPALGRRLLLGLILELTASGKDVGRIHVQKLEELLLVEGNRRICLPEGILARREYDHVTIGQRVNPSSKKDRVRSKQIGEEISFPVLLTGEGEEPGAVVPGRGVLYVRRMDRPEKALCFPQNQYTKWLDYDRIEGPLALRTRKSGDSLTIRGSGQDGYGHKSLKKYMIEEKMPKEERGKTLLLACGNDILWVLGKRIGESYKVREDTRRILEVRWMQQ